ncbi:pyridoxal-phosphate dependent enzyme [Amycolatopsis keratiniphila]|uniref:pyridoxal-phosphate dependent enzyme n=1 Tax=Amycolatopsis keratiniphila TaxID=129921 RepID=UPI001E35717F|nr:pyridoxal-phosphate dependent enzyme [Amycolatopsis keratiniphila]
MAAVGHTPLVRLATDDVGGTELYAKLELRNEFAMKDRVAREIVLYARRTGELSPGAPIVESSSGTMALGLALVGGRLGHPVHIVTDPRIDPITLAKLSALGCSVHVVDSMVGGSWQSARLTRLADLRAELPGAFWPRQYANPRNPAAYRALADELLADLGGLDVLVGAVGSGGSLCGTARALRETLPGLRVIGVDATGSVLFDQPDRPGRTQSGLGNSLRPDNLDPTVIDEVHWLGDREAFAATRELAAEQQIFGGNTSGSVYHVLRWLARTAPGVRAVGILPDRGDRYVDSVYNDGFWAERGLLAEDVSAEPAEVPYGTVVRSWSRSRLPVRERLVFIESNTTGTGMLALATARELGYEPVFFTDDPARYPELTDARIQVVRCDTGSHTALLDLVSRWAERTTVAGVTTTSELYAQAAAEVAEALGLPGPRPSGVAACRDKARTREILTAAGLTQPLYVEVDDPAEVAAACAVVGLPCVVKPVGDTGSMNVRLCDDPDEAAAHVAHILGVTHNVRGQPVSRRVLVEAFVPGPEVSVETVTLDGVTQWAGVTEKRTTAGPHFVETGHVFPAGLAPKAAAAVTDAVTRALQAVGLDHGVAHTEVRLGPAGPAVVEINPRPAGGMIPELVRLAAGVDLLDLHLRLSAGQRVGPVAAAVDTHTAIRFLLAPEEGVLVTVGGTDRAWRVAGVRDIAVGATAGARVRPPRSAYDRLGHVIAAAGDRAGALAVVDAALQTLTVVVEPDSSTSRSGDAMSIPSEVVKKQVLGCYAVVLPGIEVGDDDDFFELGGDSLGLIRVATLAQQEAGVEVDVRTFLEKPTLATLVQVLTRVDSGAR